MCQTKRSNDSFDGQDRWCDYFRQRDFLLITGCFLGCVGRLTNGLIILGTDRFEVFEKFLL